MNVISLEFNFAILRLLHCYNAKVCVTFNLAETVHMRNKSHTKFKAFTVYA